jgi:cold shock CspA family protein
MPTRTTGVLLTWISGRGFGFARCDDGGRDAWIGEKDLQYSGVKTDPQDLIGTKLSFELKQDPNGRSPRAIHIRVEAPR